MSRWNLCRALLDARMQAFPGLEAGTVAWPNRAFTKPAGKAWFKVDFLPQITESALGKDGSTHERGIYQITVFAPANDPKGIIPALQAVDSIVAHFDRAFLSGYGLTLQCSVPTPSSPIQEPDWVYIPVSIQFIAL
jgi:hypothetical protein